MATKRTRVAVYGRVSTFEQAVETQLAPVRKYCEVQGWTIVETYIDNGISGALDERPGLDKLKRDCAKGHFEVVVVYRYDRMARSTRHLLDCLELFRRNGIGFCSISEGIDTSTAVGKMVFTFLAGLAEFERSLITERVNAGIARAQAAGTHCGRPRKGFDITEAVRLQQQGLGVKQIAKRIGIPRSTVHRALQGLKRVSQKPTEKPQV